MRRVLLLVRWQPSRGLLVGAACVAVFVGTWAARVWPLMHAWWLCGLVPFLAAAIWRRWRLVVSVLLVVGCGGLGCQRGSVMARQLAPYHEFAGQHVVLMGRAAEDGVYGAHSQLAFTVDDVQLVAPRAVALPATVNVSGFGAAAVFRGDTVQVSGKLFPARGNAVARISYGELAVLGRHGTWIDVFRRRFAAGLETALPEPQASFGLGLLIGQRSTLPADVSQTLLAVGLVHIIAVSGYNLTILVQAARRLLAQRSKFQTAAACVALIVVFLLLTGSSPSIVRAGIISMVSLAAWYYGRTIPPLTLLLTAGAASVLMDPLYVWGNVSWYLSFLAFFGVLVMAPLLTRRLYGARQPGIVGQMVLETVCAELMTLPYVLWIFGQMSLVNLPANVLVAAWVPVAMLLCTVAGAAGMLAPALAGWVSWPAGLVLTYMLDMAQLLSRVPHSFLQNIGFPWPYMAVAYTALGVVLWGLWLHARRKYAIITGKKEGASSERS